eukprot:11764183-Alexandrium_andersonii.AAC.1
MSPRKYESPLRGGIHGIRITPNRPDSAALEAQAVWSRFRLAAGSLGECECVKHCVAALPWHTD